MEYMLRPYKDSLDRIMSKVLVVIDSDLEKKQPEGSLGNMMADAMMVQAEKKYGITPHLAIMNYGGIRLPVVKAGEFTLGKLYEVHPFDNRLVLMQVTGEVLLKLLNHSASRGGWPISGARMVIDRKTVKDLLIKGEVIRGDQLYWIALSDYIATGGDDALMLKGYSFKDKGYLLRDAIADYLTSLNLQGLPYRSPVEKRVRYAE